MTTTGTGRRTRLRPLALLGVLVALALQVVGLVAAPEASAHADLTATAPVAGSQVDAAPAQVTLSFSESVGIALDAVRVIDGQGKRVDAAAAQYQGDARSTVVVPLATDLPKGSYAVVWHVVSDDGHPLTGAFSFGYGVPAGAVPGELPQDRTVQWLHWAFTALWYLGAALLVGPAALVALAWPAGSGSPRIRRLEWAGVGSAGVATVALYVVQGPYGQSRSLSALTDVALLRDTLGTTLGPLLLERLAVLALAVLALGLAPRRTAVPPVAAPAVAVALGLTAGLGGHAGQESPIWLNVVVDALHFAAATTWLGGLVALAVALLPGASTAVLGAALPRWSRLAMVCVAVLVTSGGYQAWREVRSTAALTGTDYGRLLAVKVSGLVILLALGALGRRWVQRLVGQRAQNRSAGGSAGRSGGRSAGRSAGGAAGSSGGGVPGVEMLRESVLAEVVVGAVVVGLTASLVSTVPARQAYSPPYSVTLFASALDGTQIAMTVDVSTTRPGLQELHVYTFKGSDTGEPLPFRTVEASLSEPRRSLGPLRFTLSSLGPNHGTTAMVVPAAGSWQLSLKVTAGESTTYAATTRYEVTSG